MPSHATNPTGRRKNGGRISVLVADDHPVVREGLRYALEQRAGFRIVAAVGDASTAIRETEKLRPQVVVMDISMPGLNGIEATRMIAERMPEIGVVVLSMHTSPAIVRRALDAGARGYVAKDAVTEEVVRAVRTVAEGKSYIGQGLAQKMLEVGKSGALRADAVESLTAAERNIIKLVSEGKSNQEAASELGLSPRTVETYRLRLMRKLGLDNLPALVKYAIRNGIIPLE